MNISVDKPFQLIGLQLVLEKTEPGVAALIGPFVVGLLQSYINGLCIFVTKSHRFNL